MRGLVGGVFTWLLNRKKKSDDEKKNMGGVLFIIVHTQTHT